MTLHQRAYQGQKDWQAVAALIQSDDHFYHRVDFPWRLCSTSLEDGIADYITKYLESSDPYV